MSNLQAGDILEVVQVFYTDANRYYTRGMHLVLVEPASESPFGHVSDSIWVVKCPFFAPPDPRSIWTAIDAGIKEGLVRKVLPS